MLANAISFIAYTHCMQCTVWMWIWIVAKEAISNAAFQACQVFIFRNSNQEYISLNLVSSFWNNPVHPFKWRHVSPSIFGIETWRDYVNAICYQVWTIPNMFWPGFEPGPQQLHFNSNFDIREFYYKTKNK